jgi:hypothetical protein
MDLLFRVAPIAEGLLARVDSALLAAGAPAGHPIWPLLRRLGALPGELVTQLAAADVESLREAGQPLRELAKSYVDGVELMPGAAGWRGDAADAFGTQWRSLADHLAEGPRSLAGRLGQTASYLDDVAAWLAGARQAVAVALVECLGSIEAATVKALPASALGSGAAGLASAWLAADPRSRTRGASPDLAIQAAASIGAHVLRAASAALDEGEELRSRWSGRLDELPFTPVPAPGGSGGPAGASGWAGSAAHGFGIPG